jgi:hypothetical protein
MQGMQCKGRAEPSVASTCRHVASHAFCAYEARMHTKAVSNACFAATATGRRRIQSADGNVCLFTSPEAHA